jgi:predicted protein tyrosine phosphatase
VGTAQPKAEKSAAEKPVAEKPAESLPELAALIPEVLRLAEAKLNLEETKGQTVKEVMEKLSKEKMSKAEQATLKKAQQALEKLPVLNDLPFEDLYLRAAK